MNEKTLNLTPKEITTILSALADRPYKEVASLMRKILVQTGMQENQATDKGK